MTKIDLWRKEVYRALGKVLAYRNVKRQDKALEWAVRLMGLLEEQGLLPSPQNVVDELNRKEGRKENG